MVNPNCGNGFNYDELTVLLKRLIVYKGAINMPSFKDIHKVNNWII
jgi:hypothetical protein